MKEHIQRIAERLKGLREVSGSSVEALAQELGVSKEVYLQYESGTVDIPVSFLFEAAHKHNIELSAILTGDNPRLHVYCVVRKGQGLRVDRRKQYKYENLAANFIGKKAEPFMVTIDPDKDTPMEFNAHPGQEFNYVIEGAMNIIIDGHELLLNEGDSVYYNSGCKHAMKSAGDTPVKFLAIIL